MSTERTFLIQRYCSDNWAHVRGERPFIAAGPHFMDWIVPGSLEKRRKYVLRPQIKQMLAGLFPTGGIHRTFYQHQAASEALLREGILVALWSVDSRECLPLEFRWDESIRQVARELPFKTAGWANDQIEFKFWTISDAVEELLSGMQSLAMVRDYVSEDKLTLEPTQIPAI